MVELFNEILYRPLFNILIFFYKLSGDLGISIILLTVFIKLLLYPLSRKQLESQHEMKKVQPQINEIKEKYKDNKEEQSKAVMELYKKEKINPASGCLPLLIQLPILIALYRVFIPDRALLVDGEVFKLAEGLLYNFPFLQTVTEVKTTFLGIVDLTQRSIPLAVISGIFQFIQTKTIMGKEKEKKEEVAKKEEGKPEFQEVFSKQMLYMMPIVTVFFGLSFPAGLPLYWTVSTLVAIFQQMYFRNKKEQKDSLVKTN